MGEVYKAKEPISTVRAIKSWRRAVIDPERPLVIVSRPKPPRPSITRTSHDPDLARADYSVIVMATSPGIRSPADWPQRLSFATCCSTRFRHRALAKAHAAGIVSPR